MLKYVPNTLTILRFILIPFIIFFLFQERYIEAVIFLVLSGLTDVLDGYIARKYYCITNFGKLVDPLADKATQIGILVSLYILNVIPLWIIIVVFIKEVLMIVGASFLYGKETVVSSKWYGKLATVIFYIAIGCSMLVKYFHLEFDFSIFIYYLALAATLFALVMYFKVFYKEGYFKKENLKIDVK
jgi:cardiolipin synthase